MALGQIGPLTTVLEAAATAVAAGAVLGSLAAGIRGFWMGLPARRVERWALYGSYVGGTAGVAVALFDTAIRYGIMK